jgi:3-ketosteroid 9alpha-monooxygenase subunit A
MSSLAAIPKAYRDDSVGYAKGWYYVADAEEVTDGEMLPVTYLDQQLIVFRDRSGKAQVANAFCPHLGAHLASADGCIQDGEIVCPFHKWRFDTTDGVCTTIPYASAIPKRAALTTYPAIEMGGMILMWWDPLGGEPEAHPYDGIAAHSDKTWIKHSVQTYETQVPVRDLHENAFDTAHIQQLHGAEDLPEITSVERRDFGLELNYSGNAGKEGTVLTFSQFNFSGMSMVTHIVLGVGFGFIQYSTLTPIDRENSMLRNHMYIMDTGSPEQNETVGSAFADRVRIEINKDLEVLNYKKHLDRPLLCNGDGPIMKWRKYAKELVAS